MIKKYNPSSKYAGSCGTNGEKWIRTNILHLGLISEGKTRERKTNEKMVGPIAGDRCWNRNRLMNLMKMMVLM